ncbi:MAG: aminopeptidase P family protein, partial [Defluviitaleaceae bacterium]|nr:aminopeptidase P family protein [Defluviitaleaceae bacterium]
MTTNEKLSLLRKKMREHRLGAYIIPSEDAHQSEYAAEHWRGRAWLTGFDGSAGVAVVTKSQAALWVDGRYYIQAALQLTGSEFQLMKIGTDDIKVYDWLTAELSFCSDVGIDGRVLSVTEAEKYAAGLSLRGIRLKTDIDLLADIWADRPSLSQSQGAKIFDHGAEYAGKTRAEKLTEIRAAMREKNAGGYLISSLDDIAWLFNLRGGDIEFTPVFYSYAFVDMRRAYLFADETKFEDGLTELLAADEITVLSYSAVADFLRGYDYKGRIFIDPDRTSVYLKERIAYSITHGQELTAKLKAIKNGTELRNIEDTQIKDGAATVRFIKWIKEAVHTNDLEEADIHDRLIELRGEQAAFKGASFGTIAAYMANAALMHYSPVKGASAKLAPHGMLLVDSGGQYLGGTTDLTRTIALGDIPGEMKRDFTTVLRAHIALASARFLYGASGSYLDAIPRSVMWAEGLDYKCGTGHGIGYFLCVHEGPQRFRFMSDDLTRLEPGMLLTNEPGVYREGMWGIRTENTVRVTEDAETPDGRFLKFETISYCPVDLAAVDIALMSQNERAWLNAYHAMVYE